MPWLHGLPGDAAGPRGFDGETTMQHDSADKPSHSGALVATVCGAVFLLFFAPLIIVLGERPCFRMHHFESAMTAVGIYNFYTWLSAVTGIIDIVNELL